MAGDDERRNYQIATARRVARGKLERWFAIISIDDVVSDIWMILFGSKPCNFRSIPLVFNYL